MKNHIKSTHSVDDNDIYVVFAADIRTRCYPDVSLAEQLGLFIRSSACADRDCVVFFNADTGKEFKDDQLYVPLAKAKIQVFEALVGAEHTDFLVDEIAVERIGGGGRLSEHPIQLGHFFRKARKKFHQTPKHERSVTELAAADSSSCWKECSWLTQGIIRNAPWPFEVWRVTPDANDSEIPEDDVLENKNYMRFGYLNPRAKKAVRGWQWWRVIVDDLCRTLKGANPKAHLIFFDLLASFGDSMEAIMRRQLHDLNWRPGVYYIGLEGKPRMFDVLSGRRSALARFQAPTTIKRPVAILEIEEQQRHMINSLNGQLQILHFDEKLALTTDLSPEAFAKAFCVERTQELRETLCEIAAHFGKSIVDTTPRQPVELPAPAGPLVSERQPVEPPASAGPLVSAEQRASVPDEPSKKRARTVADLKRTPRWFDEDGHGAAPAAKRAKAAATELPSEPSSDEASTCTGTTAAAAPVEASTAASTEAKGEFSEHELRLVEASTAASTEAKGEFSVHELRLIEILTSSAKIQIEIENTRRAIN